MLDCGILRVFNLTGAICTPIPGLGDVSGWGCWSCSLTSSRQNQVCGQQWRTAGIFYASALTYEPPEYMSPWGIGGWPSSCAVLTLYHRQCGCIEIFPFNFSHRPGPYSCYGPCEGDLLVSYHSVLHYVPSGYKETLPLCTNKTISTPQFYIFFNPDFFGGPHTIQLIGTLKSTGKHTN